MLSFLYIYTVLQSLEYSPITMWGLCGASVRTLIFGTLAHFLAKNGKWRLISLRDHFNSNLIRQPIAANEIMVSSIDRDGLDHLWVFV
jgi:hypothetical protein